VDFKTYQSEPNKPKEKKDHSKADLNRPIQKKTQAPTKRD